MTTLHKTKIIIATIIATIALSTIGCVGGRYGTPLPPPPQMMADPDKDGAIVILQQEELKDMANDTLYDYVTGLNWEMFRSYSEMRVINQYAVSRGWTVPDTAPICRYARIPDLPVMAEFTHAGEESGELMELLMVYIYDMQTTHAVTKAVFEENLSHLKFFCVY